MTYGISRFVALPLTQTVYYLNPACLCQPTFCIFLKGLGGINGDQTSPRPTAVTVGTAKKKPEASKPKKRRGCCYWFCRCCCPCPPSDNGETSALEKDDGEDKADAKALIKQIKNITGLWDDDPEEVSPFGSYRKR